MVRNNVSNHTSQIFSVQNQITLLTCLKDVQGLEEAVVRIKPSRCLCHAALSASQAQSLHPRLRHPIPLAMAFLHSKHAKWVLISELPAMIFPGFSRGCLLLIIQLWTCIISWGRDRRCCWRPCPYAPPQGVHPSPSCCGCWLLLAQASVLSCGTALGLQEPPPLALVQEIMAVTYTSPPSGRPGQRLSDERISSLHFWWLRWQRIHLQWRKPQFDPWVGKIPGWREWQPTPVFLPGESHGQRSLVGYSPQGHKEMDTTEQLTQDMTPLGGVIHDSGLPVGSSWDQTSPKATSLLNFMPCCLLLFFPLPKKFLLRVF